MFASLAIPLIKLVGLKTKEMAEEGRFTTIIIDNHSPQVNKSCLAVMIILWLLTYMKKLRQIFGRGAGEMEWNWNHQMLLPEGSKAIRLVNWRYIF